MERSRSLAPSRPDTGPPFELTALIAIGRWGTVLRRRWSWIGFLSIDHQAIYTWVAFCNVYCKNQPCFIASRASHLFYSKYYSVLPTIWRWSPTNPPPKHIAKWDASHCLWNWAASGRDAARTQAWSWATRHPTGIARSLTGGTRLFLMTAICIDRRHPFCSLSFPIRSD